MHSQVLIATEDTWFLLPDYRKGMNAVRFYKYVQDDLFKRGAQEVIMTAKLTNAAGRILEFLGFEEVAKQYSKQLRLQDKQSA